MRCYRLLVHVQLHKCDDKVMLNEHSEISIYCYIENCIVVVSYCIK